MCCQRGIGCVTASRGSLVEQMATHMREEGRDDSWCEGHTQCDHVQRHCELIVADNGSSTMDHLIGEGRSWGIYYRRRDTEPKSMRRLGIIDVRGGKRGTVCKYRIKIRLNKQLNPW